jgi:hypothetical protein
MTVGIVEWARRARGACAWELAAADALGHRVATTVDIRVRLELLGRARRHGWRASQWEAVMPVLHDVAAVAERDVVIAAALDGLAVASGGSAALAADDELVAAAVATWRRWVEDAGVVADAPYVRAARRCLDDAAAAQVL